MRRNQACFVALDRADAMPLQVEILQCLDFVYAFLDVVFAKCALPGRMGKSHLLHAKCFGHCEQMHTGAITASSQASGRNARFYELKILGNGGHNSYKGTKSTEYL
jgi:hypothetical protein